MQFANYVAIICGCGDPSANLTVRYQTFTKEPGPYRFNATILVSCINGYTFDDLITISNNMSCLFNGEWNFLPPCSMHCFR